MLTDPRTSRRVSPVSSASAELRRSEEPVEVRVERVFREVFEDSALVVGPATTAADIPPWDSLEHINLIMALESEFGIEFASVEVTTMSRVGDLYLILHGKLGER